MISRVKDGSIIFNSDEGGLLPVKFDAQTGMTDALSGFSLHHVMAYFNQRLYHAAAGDFHEGVRSHSIDLIMKDNLLNAYLGTLSVLECVDENLRQRFIDAMVRWDPVALLEELRNAPRDEIDNPQKVKLPTPFLNYSARPVDPADQTAACELFRAIRAYQRNHVEPPEPLSKKGVSCDSFIAYSFKAAIVDALFPDGLPPEITQKMAQIDAVRSEYKAAKKNKPSMEPMKLFSVGNKYPYLNELMQLVEKYISPEQRRHFEFLQTPVKGAGIQSFCKIALSFPEFWQPAGLMFGYKDKDENIPYIMNYAAYKAFRRPDIEKKRVTPFLLEEAYVAKMLEVSEPSSENSEKSPGSTKKI